MHAAGKYRGSGAGDHDLWTVFPDYTGAAGGDGGIGGQRGTESDTAFWSCDSKPGRRGVKKTGVSVVTGVVSDEVSGEMREILEKVVSEGSGHKAYLEGYRIGGKTATSQTLPRSAHKYISSFLGFAPANDPQVLAVCIVHDPQGIYYGGTVCAPVVKNIFANILPYLGIEKEPEKE